MEPKQCSLQNPQFPLQTKMTNGRGRATPYDFDRVAVPLSGTNQQCHEVRWHYRIDDRWLF